MIGIYFSGTGNSEYCIETFLKEYHAKAFSIEDAKALTQIPLHNQIVFAYPVQYSNIPKLLKDFIDDNKTLWSGKQIFIIATMGLFCGDGAGILGRTLERHGAEIIGGLHVRMPDNICDEKVLKRSFAKNKHLVQEAGKQSANAAKMLKAGSPPRDGLGLLSHMAGLFGQRIYFPHKTNRYSDKLKISEDKCIGCGKCVRLCPLKNITLDSGIAVPHGKCTMCYRCVNACPVQAITLLGRKVVEQYKIERYL